VADPRLSAADGPTAAPRLKATDELPEDPARPIFYFDFASPECWLAAERVNHELPFVPAWVPIRIERGGAGAPRRPYTSELGDLGRRAAAQGLPKPRLPDPWPEDLDVALRAATFAAASGRVVAFSLAALRQAFAAGRDLSQVDNVLIAAAACELHPRALLKGIASRSVEERLRSASDAATSRGVRELPAVAAGADVFAGATAIEVLREALASAR
jgi:2-hydroxychromene-2-carboxylate isomerase